MNEEEKKAIKNIKKEFEKNHILPDIANEDLGTLLNLIEKQSKEIEELKNKNMELKDTYIKVAKHQEKIGHEELSEYMLAQIEAIPTFTTWEEYYDFISKQKIKDKILYRQFELQQEYKDFEDDIVLNTLQELLEERN